MYDIYIFNILHELNRQSDIRETLETQQMFILEYKI